MEKVKKKTFHFLKDCWVHLQDRHHAICSNNDPKLTSCKNPFFQWEGMQAILLAPFTYGSLPKNSFFLTSVWNGYKAGTR